MIRYLAAPLAALTLRILAVAALCLAVFAPRLAAPARPPEVLVLRDRSLSVPESRSIAAWRSLRESYRDAAVLTLDFAGRYEWRSGEPAERADLQDLSRDTTDLSQALWAALARVQLRGPASLILISDGYSTSGDPMPALRAARAAAVPLCWLPVGGAPPPIRIQASRAPATALAGIPFDLEVAVAGSEHRDVVLEADGSDGSHASTAITVEPRDTRTLRVSFTAPRPGTLAIAASLHDAHSGEVIARDSSPSVVDVRGRAHVLYLSQAATPLAVSLQKGGWPIDAVSPALAPSTPEALGEYQVVVIDNVAISDAPEAFWVALSRQINERGLGLIVLGGPNAFAGGGYLHSRLEPLLPVVSEAPESERTQAVGFVVDKSGSMGRSSAGVDRLTAARSAVIAAARGLEPQDETLLMAFDIEPHLLVPLASYSSARATLEAPWPVHAGGGTRVEPALMAAAERLAASHSQRRTLVLVTDGSINAEPANEISEALRRHSIDLTVLAVGPEADIAALGELSGASGSHVLRVGDVAELPQFMRSAVQRRRGRVEVGQTAVQEMLPVPFLSAATSWPAVSAYAVTRLRPDSDSFLVSSRKDPILAAGQAGSGRVVVLPAGLDQWAPGWIRSQSWPRFAGALVEWASRNANDPRVSVEVTDDPERLSVQVEMADDHGWSERDSLSLRITDPAGVTQELPAPAVGPGRYSAALTHLAGGLYTVTATAGTARSTRSVVHMQPDELQQFGINPELRTAVDRGLLHYCAPGKLPRTALEPKDLRAARRTLALLSLACVLGAIGIDFRFRWTGALGRILRRR